MASQGDAKFRIQNAEFRMIPPAGARRSFHAAYGLGQDDTMALRLRCWVE